MLYRYEHYMSISHMALIVVIVHICVAKKIDIISQSNNLIDFPWNDLKFKQRV